jgi:ubiquinone/menaquinone biosynthesis C-methylase UbiE
MSATRDANIVLHRGRAYDLAFGWVIRRTDGEILARAGVTAGEAVLDVGTGPGYLALAAARLVGTDGRAVGIDVSPEMIARARLLAARAGSAAEYLVAGADALPFADGSFDAVVSRLVFQHLSGDVKRRALREIMRVLTPSGRLVVADLGSPAASAHHALAHLLGKASDAGVRLPRLLADAGFAEITYGPVARGILTGVAARAPERDRRA